MTQQTTHSSGQRQMVNPMVHLLRDREIGRMAWVMPLTRGITRDSSLKLMLYIGLAALWHGRFLGNRYPRISYAIEQSGAVCFILSFFGLLGLYLPPHLVWVCGVCCAVSVVPFILNFLPTEDRAPENLRGT